MNLLAVDAERVPGAVVDGPPLVAVAATRLPDVGLLAGGGFQPPSATTAAFPSMRAPSRTNCPKRAKSRVLASMQQPRRTLPLCSTTMPASWKSSMLRCNSRAPSLPGENMGNGAPKGSALTRGPRAMTRTGKA